jgi:hypothetical protein
MKWDVEASDEFVDWYNALDEMRERVLTPPSICWQSTVPRLEGRMRTRFRDPNIKI